MRLSHSLGLENIQAVICFRLGRIHATQNRPLGVANKSHRKYLLDNAKTLPEKAPLYMKIAQYQENSHQSNGRKDKASEDKDQTNNNNKGDRTSRS